MKNSEIEKKLLFLAYNLKGKRKKRDDWITIAETCKETVEHFNSYNKVAERTGTSPELIRSVVKLLELPPRAKKILKEGKIGMDIAQRIARLKNPQDRIRVAKDSVGLTAHEARDLVRFVKRNPGTSKEKYEKYRNKILDSKNKQSSIHISMIALEEESYNKLKKIASKKGVSVDKLIKKIISNSLKEGFYDSDISSRR